MFFPAQYCDPFNVKLNKSNIAELIKLKAIKPNKGFFTSAGIFVDG